MRSAAVWTPFEPSERVEGGRAGNSPLAPRLDGEPQGVHYELLAVAVENLELAVAAGRALDPAQAWQAAPVPARRLAEGWRGRESF